MKIKNSDNLALNELRRSALKIAEAGLQAIDTEQVIRNTVSVEGDTLVIGGERFSLEGVGRIFVVGVGKCASDAAYALENILGERLIGGVIVDIKKGAMLKNIIAYQGSHPLPSNENVKASASIVGLLRGLRENDLVIFVVSGGGSTLLCLPQDLGCQEEAQILHVLMAAGATIQEINTVRKHLSLARGGYLAQYAYPAQVVSLIFSDVPGDDIQFVASGPTVKDNTTISDAQAILGKYDVLNKCGIEKCGLVETPKDDKYFEKVKNIVVVSNLVALDGMAEEAKKLGFTPKICATCLIGETRVVAEQIMQELHAAPRKTVLLYGGETTVTLKGHGEGGRNMEFALSCLQSIADGEVILAIASDGRDNSEVAGAICDIITKEKAAKRNLDAQKFLEENNELPFFRETGDFLMTGDTGSNVSDLLIAMKG